MALGDKWPLGATHLVAFIAQSHCLFLGSCQLFYSTWSQYIPSAEDSFSSVMEMENKETFSTAAKRSKEEYNINVEMDSSNIESHEKNLKVKPTFKFVPLSTAAKRSKEEYNINEEMDSSKI